MLLVLVGGVLQIYLLSWIGRFAIPVASLKIQRADGTAQGRRIVEEIVVMLNCDTKCLCGVLKMVQEVLTYLLTYSMERSPS